MAVHRVGREAEVDRGTYGMNFETMEFRVESFDGDYVYLKRVDKESDELKLVARALLPPEIAEGSLLRYEMMQYELLSRL